jgi:recombinational DNA repair protein RecT
MARKTVIKRHAKRLPLSSEVEHVINSEHDNPDFSKSIKKDETLFETKPAEVTEQDA